MPKSGEIVEVVSIAACGGKLHAWFRAEADEDDHVAYSDPPIDEPDTEPAMQVTFLRDGVDTSINNSRDIVALFKQNSVSLSQAVAATPQKFARLMRFLLFPESHGTVIEAPSILNEYLGEQF